MKNAEMCGVLYRAVLMDVRRADKFFACTCPNSQNFPLYQPISGMGLAANIRRAGFAFFGVYGTERNMQWLQEVEAAVPKGERIHLHADMNTLHVDATLRMRALYEMLNGQHPHVVLAEQMSWLQYSLHLA
jgi:hypothetical protein